MTVKKMSSLYKIVTRNVCFACYKLLLYYERLEMKRKSVKKEEKKQENEKKILVL